LGPTKTKILNELGGNGRKTAAEIAFAIRVQVSAARKHLESLHASGLVIQEFVRDGVGRPKKFYSLSELGRELFPRQYELVLNSFIEKLIANTDRPFVESIVKKVASDIAKPKNAESQNIASKQTFLERMDHLVNSLGAFGFDTSLERNETGNLRLVSHNCPLYKVAKKHPDLMCQAFHTEIIRAALGTDSIRLEGCVLSGDTTCVHSVLEKADRI
jgi:predicted ArsR family transcriptional regulator